MTDPATAPIRYFTPGVPGPGRPKGSRQKVATSFFDNLYAVWQEQGDSALRRAAFHEPMAFVAMVAKLMPQKIEISTPTDGMSDERFAELLDLAERMSALADAKAEAVALSAPMTIDGQAVEVKRGAGGKDEEALGGKVKGTVHIAPPLDGLFVSAAENGRPLDDLSAYTPYAAGQNLEPPPMRLNDQTESNEEAILAELFGDAPRRTSIHNPDVPLGEIDPAALF